MLTKAPNPACGAMSTPVTQHKIRSPLAQIRRSRFFKNKINNQGCKSIDMNRNPMETKRYIQNSKMVLGFTCKLTVCGIYSIIPNTSESLISLRVKIKLLIQDRGARYYLFRQPRRPFFGFKAKISPTHKTNSWRECSQRFPSFIE